ncbi:MAG: DUF6152 family protein [Steroidobacteraceae bacterium]
MNSHRLRTGLLTTVGLLALAPSVGAHHSFAAMYDATKPIRLTGKLLKVEWVNPHAHFVLEVRGKNGQTTEWSVEGAGPGALSRRGFNKNDVRIGDELTVDGYLARSGKRVIDGQRVTLPDGRVFDSGSAGAGGPGGNAAPLPAAPAPATKR